MKITYKALENAEFAMSVHQVISSPIYDDYFSRDDGNKVRQFLLDNIKNYNSLDKTQKRLIKSSLNTLIEST